MLGEKTSPITQPSKKASNPSKFQAWRVLLRIAPWTWCGWKTWWFVVCTWVYNPPRKPTWNPTIHRFEDFFSFPSMGFSGSMLVFGGVIWIYPPPRMQSWQMSLFRLGSPSVRIIFLLGVDDCILRQGVDPKYDGLTELEYFFLQSTRLEATLRILTPPMETPDRPNDTPGALKQVAT